MIRTPLTAVLLFIFTTAVFLPASAQEASFQGLGQMPGAATGFGTYSQNISADGSAIVGYAWVCASGVTCTSTEKTYAFRWTTAGKYQVLGHLGGDIGNMAFAASSDGSVIVGNAPNPKNDLGFGAFGWTQTKSMVALPPSMFFANGVTLDGNMAVGGDIWLNNMGKGGKFGPLLPGLPDLTEAFAASGTITAPIVVGTADAGDRNDAFLWTPTTGMQDLGSLGGPDTAATAISEDGSVVVGESTVPDGALNLYHAFRWTAQTGMQDLGTLGGAQSEAFAVNHDGSVIVGYSDTTRSSGSAEAFIWTAQTGMQSLLAVLQAHGVHTADRWVTIAAAGGLSADGTIITGWGQSPPTKESQFGVPTPFRVVLPPQ